MSYSSAALATFDNLLGTLDHLTGRAMKAGMADSLLAETKLAPDMYPLETQFRIAVNQVLLALGRVWSMDLPLDETPYATWAEVRARIAAAKARVAEAHGRDALPAEAEVDVTLPNDMRFVCQAHEHIRDWTMPNFYFHAATAYGLLRGEGLDLGKADFLGFMLRHACPGATAA